MPEITDAELRTFVAYQQLGSPQEITKKIGDLEKDNHRYRQEEKPALEARLPKEGEVVVPKEKAAALESYEKLGKPEDLQKTVTEVEELRTKDAARTREDAFRGAAKAMGWPEETVATLLDMRSLDGAKIELKKEKGKDAKGAEVEMDVPYVTLAGDGAQPQKFSEFAANTPQLKGLKVEAADRKLDSTRTFPRQVGNGSPAQTAPTEEEHRKSVRTRVDYSI